MDTTTTHTRRTARRSEQGSALIVALMVVLALTALGLVGLKQTSFELRTSANARYTSQAFHVSNASLTAFSDRVGANGQAYWTYMRNLKSYNVSEGNTDAEYEYNVDKSELYSDQQFFTAGASIGACSADKFSPDCVGFQAEQNTPFDFNVQMNEPKDGPRAPGFSNQFCFKRFTFQSNATVHAADWTPGAPVQFGKPAQASSRGHITYALVGPLDCTGGYYN